MMKITNFPRDTLDVLQRKENAVELAVSIEN
jgi:hypothetical protein